MAAEKRNLILYAFLSSVLVILLHLLFMLLSGKDFFSVDPYNSYSKQCVAWLHGSLALDQNYPWLELAVYKGQYFVSFPPFPSYVLLPFAVFLGENTPDVMIALLSVLIGTVYAVRITNHFSSNPLYSIFLPVFLYCGTAVWQITVDGSVWFIAQNFALTLSLMSFYYAISGHKGRSFFFLACAVGCRPFQILYFPFITYLLFLQNNTPGTKNKIKEMFLTRIWTFSPALLIGVSYAVLNYVRFGNPFEFGHNYLPEFVNSAYGQFSLSYVPENFLSLFRLPTYDAQNHTLSFPQFNGMNIFISFPILMWHLFLTVRAWKLRLCLSTNGVNSLSVILICVHVFCILTHKTMGGFHFGNRYIADILPCVFVATCWLSKPFQNETYADSGGNEIDTKTVLSIFLFHALFLFGLIVNFTGVLNFYLHSSL